MFWDLLAFGCASALGQVKGRGMGGVYRDIPPTPSSV